VSRVEDLLRELAPQVLGALVRRHGRFDACEDAVQEALLAAAVQWPGQGVPEHPRGWLITVATRRLTDELRSEGARRRREAAHAEEARLRPETAEADDTLVLLSTCCHPALSGASQIALTLRAVGGLTTAEIARAFLVPEATIAQRISRAKATIKASGTPFALPDPPERDARLAAVLHVLYLIFNEGYTASSGAELARADLTREAIRLTREVRRRLPEDGEVAGLLALMLLTDARRPARTGPDGALVPLAEQDRGRWDAEAIREGLALVSDALARTALGPYQLQAAIAAVHAEAARAEATDWCQIALLYGQLERALPTPVVTLNRAVAVAMAYGAAEGLALVEPLAGRLDDYHLLHATRADLLRREGRRDEAAEAYGRALALATNEAERRFLADRLAECRT
jgi:RNA polymerase sigma factor (sigma-70 family)